MPQRRQLAKADEVREEAVVYGEAPPSVPPQARGLAGFREWTRSESFPEDGRIDYLGGDLEFEMSPEDLHTHGTVKTAIAAELYSRIARVGLGFVFADRTRVSSPTSDLSVEPDLVAVLFSSLDAGRVRQIPASGKGPGRFIELEGAPDLVVEIVSDSSVRKDTRILPPRYARAGVRELWRVDARGGELSFEVRLLAGGEYRLSKPAADGWTESAVLGGKVRLRREPTRHGGWLYELLVE